METTHGGEVVGEGFGVSSLQLLNQELYVGGDDFLFGEGLFAVDGGYVLGGVHDVCSLGWLLHVRVDTRHVHAERHLAKAGVANGKVFERSFLGGPRASVGEPKPGGRMALQSARGDPLAGLSTLLGAERRNYWGGRCGRERSAEVGVENAQAVEARRKRPPSSTHIFAEAFERLSTLYLLADGQALRDFLLRYRLRLHLFT